MLPSHLERPGVMLDEMMQVSMPVLAQLTDVSEPQKKDRTPSGDLPVAGQFTPADLMHRSDAADVPDLEVRYLDDIGSRVRLERDGAVDQHPDDLIEGVELAFEGIADEEGILPQPPTEGRGT